MPKLFEIWPGQWLDLRLIYNVSISGESAVIVLYGAPDRSQRLQRPCSSKDEAARIAGAIADEVKLHDELDQLVGKAATGENPAGDAKIVNLPHQTKK